MVLAELLIYKKITLRNEKIIFYYHDIDDITIILCDIPNRVSSCVLLSLSC